MELLDITGVRVLDGYCIELTFEDGAVGTVDIAEYTGFQGVFAALRDVALFRQVHVLDEIGTIGWPNGLDLDPVVLYCTATHQPLPDFTKPERKRRASSPRTPRANARPS